MSVGLTWIFPARVRYGRNLEGGREKAAATRIGDYGSSISMYLRDGLLCVDATIFSGPHIPLIEVVCNRARINAPGWDTNFSDKAMEVVDQNRSPIDRGNGDVHHVYAQFAHTVGIPSSSIRSPLI
jgi:hypothetical protein